MRRLKVVSSSSRDSVILNLVRIWNPINTLKLGGVGIVDLCLGVCAGLHLDLAGLSCVATDLLTSPASSLRRAHRSEASGGGGVRGRPRQGAVPGNRVT